MAIINLYPPIVDTFMPAFLIRTGINNVSESCRVYFSLSIYNSASEIGNVQVTVTNQDTNISALNKNYYPSEIMLKLLQTETDAEKISNGQYYIEINPQDIEGGGFKINTYYKVQLRFTAKNISKPLSIDITNPAEYPQKIDTWLNLEENLSSFSEWSTVCLIRGISQPSLQLLDLEQNVDEQIVTSTVLDIIGKINFEDSNETDYLKNYRLEFYDSENNLFFDSGDVYIDSYAKVNEINYKMKKALKDGEDYTLKVSFTTYNLYTTSNTFLFTVLENSIEKIDATVTALLDEENARIGVHILGKSTESFLGNITIRRASSKDDFSIWEDVITFTLKDGKPLDVIWYDYTVESGIWYKYGIQKRDSLGTRGVITPIRNPVMIMFEDVFLNSAGKQLKIKYNQNVSSMKNVVLDSHTNTIGSKYPFVKRNANTNYKQFPLAGLITHFTDDDNIFTSKEQIFNNSLELYKNYNWENNISDYNDYILEREFRNKVSDFLYDGKVKLFRSLTEGNILIKLTDVSFTPEQQLGRYVYSFSCTATEVDDCSIENLDNYDIQKIGTYDKDIEYSNSMLGQINEKIPANTNILLTLNKKYELLAAKTYKIETSFLDYLRIEFQDKPYLISDRAGGPIKSTTAESNKNAYLGYIANINGQTIVIPPNGVYTLENSELQITSLSFPVDTHAIIDYNIKVDYVIDPSKLIKRRSYYQKVGQFYEIFNPDDRLYSKMWSKYYAQYTTYFQTVASIDNVTIEANPGTVVYIKEALEDYYNKHIIGETCTLTVGDEFSSINDIYFTGIHFNEKTDNSDPVYPTFIETGIEVNDFSEIVNPIFSGVYIVNSKRYIYYNNQWYRIDDNNEIECPVQVLIDYTVEIMKGAYQNEN